MLTDTPLTRRAPQPEPEAEQPPAAEAQGGLAQRWATVRDRALGVWRRLVAWGRPPDVWTYARPSLCEVWTYAREGAWTAGQGPYRAVGVAYGWVMAVPTVAVAYVVAWLVERPTRAVAAFALARLTWESDWVRTAAAVATWPIRFLFTPVL